jgi:hypothetical protein
MNIEEAKEFVNQRFAELTQDNQDWSRSQKANTIIRELRVNHNFTLTTPTGQRILAVTEDEIGIIYQVG